MLAMITCYITKKIIKYEPIVSLIQWFFIFDNRVNKGKVMKYPSMGYQWKCDSRLREVHGIIHERIGRVKNEIGVQNL